MVSFFLAYLPSRMHSSLATFVLCPAHLILLGLIISRGQYKLLSCSLCSPHQPRTTTSLFTLNILPSTLLSNALTLCYQRPVFTPIQEQRENYNFVYSDFYVFRRQIRWQKVLNWMAADIAQIQSALNFPMNKFLIFYSCSQIFELCHIFKGSDTYLYVMILPCILVSREQHVLSFLCVYFYANHLISIN
jgi:hypothetical protein